MIEFTAQRSADLGGHLGPRVIAILPMGSTEPHGPHLPLDTDGVLAMERARRAARQLEERGVDTVILPLVPYGISRLAQDFDGGITLRPGTLWALVEDLLLSLQQDGVRQLVLCNAHHEHEQERILGNLATDYCRRGPGQCQLLYPEQDPDLQPRFREEECFGGRRETSMMLAVAPDLVDQQVAAGLPQLDLSFPVAEPHKNRSLVEIGASAGYLGAPAEAQASGGGPLLDAWARALVDSCASTWPDLFSDSAH